MATRRPHFVLLASVALVAGCRTVCMEPKRDLSRFVGGPEPVFVNNPELSREYDILRRSKIYHLSTQTNGARRVTLYPNQQLSGCGNPLILTFYTFGIIPGYLPGRYFFEYDLEADGSKKHITHVLPVYERYSIWDALVIRREERTLAKALRWSTLVQSPFR